MQTYSLTGEFTVQEKMKSSIKSNVILYSIMGVVLGIVFIYYIIRFSIKLGDIPATVASASNAYGLFLLIAMLGHGLVNVPRRLWRRSSRDVNLKRYYFNVARYERSVQQSCEKLTKTLGKVRKASDLTAPSDSLRVYVDVIISKCPTEEYRAIPRGQGDIDINKKKLASLHEKVMNDTHAAKMYRSLFNHNVRQAIRCQDIVNSKGSGEWKISWTLKKERKHVLSKVFNTIEYFWYCYVEARVFQLLCILLAGLSLVIIWSELVFSACTLVGIDLSIFSLFIRAIYRAPPFILQAAIFLPVLYISWCAYSSLFKLRLFNYYHIVPHHMSDSNSLLFSAAYLCRLTAPMAYNFMEMSHYTDTEFVTVMGNLDVELESASANEIFQTFFPVLLFPFILLTLFNVYSKILAALHIKRFQFTEEFEDSHIEDGKTILNEERERLLNSSGADMSIVAEAKDIAERYNNMNKDKETQENQTVRPGIYASAGPQNAPAGPPSAPVVRAYPFNTQPPTFNLEKSVKDLWPDDNV